MAEKYPAAPKRRNRGVELKEKKKREGRIDALLHSIDPEGLDCSICMEPLIVPVFQCKNGHIVCSSCCTKLEKKCPSCPRSIAYSRCLAIEKVLESIGTSCPYVQYGCKERMRYNQKGNHEVTCMYAPRECPFSDCSFHGSFEQLSLHLNDNHLASITSFWSNLTFTVSLGKKEQVLVFKSKIDGLLLILNNRLELNGNAISMTCIRPSSPKERVIYTLRSRRGDTTLTFRSRTESNKGQREGSSTDYLLVPYHFNGCDGKLELQACSGKG